MEIKTAFDINQKVTIMAINQPGTICKIQLDGNNVFYEVSYWWEGQLRFVMLDASELK
jgi:hypothetical protein